ncbi:MAG: hypothetical protein NZ957_05825 [Thaumarchaeota archaeon]|nr:hypothetical protein [Candidatus Calditenuaceae archaeon]
MRPTVKSLTIKSLLYRVWIVVYELTLAYVLIVLGIHILTSTPFGFILVNNSVKFFGYLLWELIWFGYLRTRLNLLKRLLKV